LLSSAGRDFLVDPDRAVEEGCLDEQAALRVVLTAAVDVGGKRTAERPWFRNGEEVASDRDRTSFIPETPGAEADAHV